MSLFLPFHLAGIFFLSPKLPVHIILFKNHIHVHSALRHPHRQKEETAYICLHRRWSYLWLKPDAVSLLFVYPFSGAWAPQDHHAHGHTTRHFLLTQRLVQRRKRKKERKRHLSFISMKCTFIYDLQNKKKRNCNSILALRLQSFSKMKCVLMINGS